MKLPIVKIEIDNICLKCPNYKGINKHIFNEIFEIKCLGNGEIEESNCDACVNTLNYVGKKYNYSFLLNLGKYYTR